MEDELRLFGLACTDPSEFQECFLEWQDSPFRGASWIDILFGLLVVMTSWEESGFRLKATWRGAVVEAALWQHCYYSPSPTNADSLTEIL